MSVRLGTGLLVLVAHACLAQPEQSAVERVKLATGLMAKHDYGGAIRELRRVLELQPDQVAFELSIGQS